jgi:predicted acyl esterase
MMTMREQQQIPRNIMGRVRSRWRHTAVTLLLCGVISSVSLVAAALVFAQSTAPLLTASETMIPMRDGLVCTQIMYPLTPASRYRYYSEPVRHRQLDAARLSASLPELNAEGFIIVSQDIRGRFKSEG